MSANVDDNILPEVRDQLEAIGFTFHEGTNEDDAELNGKHWYSWCGPDNEWDVECGEYHDHHWQAVTEALACSLRYMAEQHEENKEEEVEA